MGSTRQIVMYTDQEGQKAFQAAFDNELTTWQNTMMIREYFPFFKEEYIVDRGRHKPDELNKLIKQIKFKFLDKWERKLL